MSGWICEKCGRESRVSIRCTVCGDHVCPGCIREINKKPVCKDCAKEMN